MSESGQDLYGHGSGDSSSRHNSISMHRNGISHGGMGQGMGRSNMHDGLSRERYVCMCHSEQSVLATFLGLRRVRDACQLPIFLVLRCSCVHSCSAVPRSAGGSFFLAELCHLVAELRRVRRISGRILGCCPRALIHSCMVRFLAL